MTDLILPGERVAIRGTCPTICGILVRYVGAGKAEVRLDETRDVVVVVAAELRAIRQTSFETIE